MATQSRVEIGSECFFRECASKVYDEDTSVCEKGLRLVIEETEKSLKVNREVTLSEVAELSILREAQRELGVTRLRRAVTNEIQRSLSLSVRAKLDF